MHHNDLDMILPLTQYNWNAKQVKQNDVGVAQLHGSNLTVAGRRVLRLTVAHLALQTH
jgi:hypothetical protein